MGAKLAVILLSAAVIVISIRVVQLKPTLWSACIFAFLLPLFLATVLGITIFKKERHFHSSLLAERGERQYTEDLYRQEVAARKRLELELRRSQESMQTAMEAAAVGTWDWDVVTDEQIWSDTSRALFGLPSDCLANFEVLMNAIHPEDRETIRTAIDQAVRDGRDYQLEYRTVWPDGSVHWIWDKGRAFLDPAGRATRMSGVSINIDERKRAEEEARWKTAFLEAQANSTIDGILVVDAQNQQILQNERFIYLLNIPPAIVGQKDDTLRLQHVLSQTKNPEQFLEKIAYLNSHPDKISRDEIEFKNGMVIDRYSAPVVGKDGKYYGRIWTFRDITERKHNEDKLRQLSLAVDQSPVLIEITDAQGRISYVNQKFTECTGYAPEEVRGRNPSILKSGHTSNDEYKNLWDTITHGREWRGEFQNRKKNGALYWESAVITPVKDSNGTISHYVAIKEDITERKTMESQLRQAQKLEAIGQLAAGIAHEINTPAQYVGDNTTFLKESWGAIVPLLSAVRQVRTEAASATVSPQTMERFESCWKTADVEYLQAEIPRAIDQSLEGIQRVTKIVRAMKEFSHPGSEEKQPVDINKAIETTITVARNEWKYVAEVETCLEASLPLVSCHAAEFNQVILNLLVNSSQAIAQVVGDGSCGKGKIMVTTRREGEWVEVSIRDTGAGIPVAAQPRIFEPFFTTKPVGKGTGQGLALAYNTIVKRHGGRIWFATEPGKGTTFFIRLPLSGRASEASC